MFSNDKVHLDGSVARYFRKTSLPVRAGFHHFSVKHKARTPTVLSFFVGRWVNCPMFSLWTNRWSVWSTHFFSLHIFNLSLFYFFFFLFLPIHRLCSACWSLFRQNLTFKGTWWKLNHLSELVLYLFFFLHRVALTSCLFTQLCVAF